MTPQTAIYRRPFTEEQNGDISLEVAHDKSISPSQHSDASCGVKTEKGSSIQETYSDTATAKTEAAESGQTELEICFERLKNLRKLEFDLEAIYMFMYPALLAQLLAVGMRHHLMGFCLTKMELPPNYSSLSPQEQAIVSGKGYGCFAGYIVSGWLYLMAFVAISTVLFGCCRFRTVVGCWLVLLVAPPITYGADLVSSKSVNWAYSTLSYVAWLRGWFWGVWAWWVLLSVCEGLVLRRKVMLLRKEWESEEETQA